MPLSPVKFSSPAADTYQYVDATQSTTYGTITAGPPSGMGTDDTTPTNLTEASYSDTQYTQLEYAGFGSLPAGWTSVGFSVVSGYALSDQTSGTRVVITQNYDLSSYTGARFTYKHAAYHPSSYPYESGDYEVWYLDTGVWTLIANVPASDPSGVYLTQSESVTYSGATEFRLIASSADATERIKTDDWYIEGFLTQTCYRLEAVFRFDSVTTGLGTYILYIDFYSALTGSDDLDFYIGTSTNPTTQISADKQNDFSVDVSSYITASTIYLKIADNYRSGDTSQTIAQIQRCYLYSSEQTVGWMDTNYLYRKQISVIEQSGAGTNYQIPIWVYYNDSSTDVAGSVDCEGLCQTNFSDIRFTASNGTTQLSYWMQNSTASDRAYFWVKVTADISSTAYDVKIFIYFGYSTATTASSIGGTMIIGDDFSGASLNTTLWDTQGDVTLSGGYARFYGTGTCDYPEIKSKAAFNFNVRNTKTEMSIYITSLTQKQHGWSIKSTGSAYLMYSLIDDSAANSGFMIDWNGGGYDDTYTGLTYAATYDYYMSMSCDALSSPKQEWFTNATTHTYSTNTMTSVADYYLMYGNYNWGGNGDVGATWDEKIDYLFLRKFVNTEPTFDAPANIEYQDSYSPVIAATTFSPVNPTTATGISLFAVVTDDDTIKPNNEVYFEPIGYPAAYNNTGDLYATEIGTNTWSYSIASADLVAGVYCFVTHAVDSAHSTVASYTQYLMFQVTTAAITCYIRIFDTLGNYIPFETFNIYLDGARQYTDTFTSDTSTQHEVEVRDRYDEQLNFTTFDAGTVDFVLTVDVYSLKFMSYYTDFCYFNLTRNSNTYTEVIAPLEIVSFRLFAGTYNYGINFRNGSGWCVSGTVNLVNSTAIIITGSGVSDLLGLITGTYALSTGLNVSVTTLSTDVYTIQLMFDWTNTTLYGQTVNILAAFNWDNTTIYNQTLSLLNAFNSTNTVIYDQLILLQNMFNWENTTLFNQTVSILNAFNSTNSVLYDQTVSILSNISYYGSTIYGQTVSILSQLSLIGSNVTAGFISIAATLSAIDSSLLANFTSVTATLTSIGSNITTDYLALAATLSMIDTNLLANFTQVSATLSAIDSSLLSNFTTVTSTLSAIGSNVTTDYLSLVAELSAIDSSLLSNFTSITATLSAIGSNITAQTVELLSYIWNNNNSIYNQTVNAISYIVNTNATIYNQLISQLAVINNLNATIYNQVISQLLLIYQNSLNKGGDNDVVEYAILGWVQYGIIGLFGFIFLLDLLSPSLPWNKSRRGRATSSSPDHNRHGGTSQAHHSTGGRQKEPWEYGDDRRSR